MRRGLQEYRSVMVGFGCLGIAFTGPFGEVLAKQCRKLVYLFVLQWLNALPQLRNLHIDLRFINSFFGQPVAYFFCRFRDKFRDVSPWLGEAYSVQNADTGYSYNSLRFLVVNFASSP